MNEQNKEISYVLNMSDEDMQQQRRFNAEAAAAVEQRRIEDLLEKKIYKKIIKSLLKKL